jgi:hypothetical protein
MALQPELGADAVALVRGKEELETFFAKVCINQLEPLWIGGMDGWIGQLVADSLKIADQKAALRALEGEV